MESFSIAPPVEGSKPQNLNGSPVREFVDVLHGYVVGDRVYVQANGSFAKGGSTTGEKIPRLQVVEIVDANTFKAIPIGGDWLVEAGTWDITNGGTETNSRYSQTQDDGTLGHAPGTLNNVERYLVTTIGADLLWILLPGRPIVSGMLSDAAISISADGVARSQGTDEDNPWLVNPSQIVPPSPAGPAATTILLRPASTFPASGGGYVTLKNAS